MRLFTRTVSVIMPVNVLDIAFPYQEVCEVLDVVITEPESSVLPITCIVLFMP